MGIVVGGIFVKDGLVGACLVLQLVKASGHEKSVDNACAVLIAAHQMQGTVILQVWTVNTGADYAWIVDKGGGSTREIQ